MSDTSLRHPAGISRSEWERIPLAKRRLITLGPIDPGREPFGAAVRVAAAELRLQGVSEDVARRVCRAIPLTVDSTPKHKVLRSVTDWVRWAYNPPDGLPILSGCPRSPKHSGACVPSRLRAAFESYCDDDCARSCRLRSVALNPGIALNGGEFAPIQTSTVWMPRIGLGPTSKMIWEYLAALATHDTTQPVAASSRFLTCKLNGLVSGRTVRNALRELERHALVTLVDRRTGKRLIHARDTGWVEALEQELGTSLQARANVAEASRESLDYALWRWEWDDADELVGGTGRRKGRGKKTSQ